MVVGILLGTMGALPALFRHYVDLQFGQNSQINVPIAVLIWLMITPMMMKVDFGAVRNVGRKPADLIVTLFVNWLVKPFSMALLAWFFSGSSSPGSFPGRSRPVHCRLHHSRRCPLYRDGVRLELSDERGSGVHTRAGLRQ